MPSVSGKKLVKLLQWFGYAVIRQTGSHVVLVKEWNNKNIVIPIHGNKDLGYGLILKIIKDAEVSKSDIGL